MAQVTIIPAKNHADEIVRTAAYARVSSDSEDQLNSFNAQIRYYTEMLQNSDNAVFVDMYADEGISGTGTAKREEFQRLMNDCRKGKIDRILTKSVSRFARNTKDCVHKRMADGTYISATAPFGYDYVNGKLIINPKKAKIVKQIFSWYISGIGMNEIAKRLNQLDVRKEIWRHGTIHCILTNEKYIGDTLLQKQFTTDTLPFKEKINRGEKEQFYIKKTHEPIIEKSIFDAAQKIYSEREKTRGYATESSPFRTKIYCGTCGTAFRRKQRKNCVYWVCRNHDESAENCPIKQIRETEFQAAFIRLWNKLQAHYKAVLAPMLRQLETLSEREKSGNIQLAELRKEISEIKRQIHLLTILNSQGTIDGAYFKERSAELDRKLLNSQKQLRASLDDSDSERLDELRRLIAILEKSEQITEFDEVKFGQIVERITVLSDSEIRFELIGKIGFTERIAR